MGRLLSGPESSLEYAVWPSPLGSIRIGLHDGRLASLVFCDTVVETDRQQAKTRFKPFISWLEAYFARQRPVPDDLPLLLNGTPFQIAVWNIMKTVPWGSLASYREIAQCLPFENARNYSRAVGSTIARNPIWIVLPCHRIIHADGSPGGYAGGLRKKLALQEIEKSLC